MLYLSFSAHVEQLALQMMKRLKTDWSHNLFLSPQVVFADAKMEQWFRLLWVEQFGVLANLYAQKLETFLWQSLSPPANTHLLGVDILQHLIQAALLSPTKNELGEPVLFYETLKGLDVFLASSNSEEKKKNLVKLSYLSSRLAYLFLEYEYSRPSHFYKDEKGLHEGILEAWKDGKSKPFFSTALEEDSIESWQRKLYGKIFHASENDGISFFAKAFNNATPGTPAQLTLSYLYEQRTEEEKKKLWSNKSIYLFGIGGISQFHRCILQDMAQYTDLHVYIQNPCAEFWEDVKTDRRYSRSFNKENSLSFHFQWQENDDGQEAYIDPNENELLGLWGKSGRDNIKLWCEAAAYNFNYEYIDIKPQNVLTSLQKSILDRQNKSDSLFGNDDSLVLVKAPSPLLEIEFLREQIWKDMESDKTLRLDEILVLAPNLDDYRVAIERVFNSTDYSSSEYLPFTFADAPESESLVAEAIRLILQMAKSREINRLLFFELVRNPVIQAGLKINNDIVSAWETWVSELNIYRNKNQLSDISNPHSFSHGLRRLLLNYMMHDRYETREAAFHPYGNIESASPENLNIFCEIVEELENLISNTQHENIVELLEQLISQWISTHDFSGEKAVKEAALKALDYTKWQVFAGRESISFEELEEILNRELIGSRPGTGQFLLSGISFINLQNARTLPMKNVYIIGMNAKTFPGKNKASTLDLRYPIEGRQSRWPGDSDSVNKNRFAFLCQVMSARQKLYLSYLGKNLRKDEELYPSSVIEELRGFLNKAIMNEPWNEYVIPMDEKRSIQDIYSSRRLEQKMILELPKGPVLEKASRMKDLKPLEIPQELSVSSLTHFLLNPFEFQIRETLHLEKDEEVSQIELEPITLSSIDRSTINKELFLDSIENGKADSFFLEKQETGALPESLFSKKIISELKVLLNNQKEKIDLLIPSYSEGDEVSCSIFIKERNKKIILKGKPDWQGHSEDSLIFFTLFSNKISDYKKLNLYLCALIKVIQEQKEMEIFLYGFNESEMKKTKKTPEDYCNSFRIDVAKAESILKSFIEKAYLERFALHLPFSLISKYENKSTLLSKLEKERSYLSETLLFDINDWGYSDLDETATKSIIENWKELFSPLFN